AGIHDDEKAAGPRCRLTIFRQDPKRVPCGHCLFVVSIEDRVVVDESIERRRYPNAALGLYRAEAGLEKIRVGGGHLETHGAFAVTPPSALRLLPAEVVDPHSLSAVAANAVLVAGAFRAEVEVRNGVFEDAGWRDEVIECARLAGRRRRSADEME